MIYLMSDLHGETGLFVRMLQKINFSGNDTLYVLGDVIDRCPGGITLLQWIMAAPNMILLKGNHEAMLLDAYATDGSHGALRRWFACGGDVTYHRMQQLPPDERESILHYLTHLPEELELCVNGRTFHLVHGRPSKESLQRLWHRPWSGERLFHDKTTIVGHTPTVHFGAITDKGQQRIFFDHSFIAIDCGCGKYSDPSKRLGCLRLDDLKTFYV